MVSLFRRIGVAIAGRSYAAAKQPNGRTPWLAPRTGPNRAMSGAGTIIAARAHDAVRNNPYAARIVDVWTANLVGTGITTSWQDAAVAQAWEMWSQSLDCDAAGSFGYSGLQELSARAMVQGGEALIWRQRVNATLQNPVGLQLLVLEGDRLDWTFTGTHAGNRVSQGIEINALGRPVAYHLLRDDRDAPMVSLSGARIRVPAQDIIHLYRRRRPGQLRDVSWLAPILWSLRDLTEYDSALIRKAYVEACLAVVVSGDGGLTEGDGAQFLRDANNQVVEAIEPQMILYRDGPGDVTTISPSGGGSHIGFAKRTLEGASVGSGLTYDQVSGDLSNANYSSLRAGKIEFRRHLEQVQYTLLVPVMCQRIAEWFWQAGRDSGVFSGVMPKARHVPPAPEMVDPGKDGQALLMLVRAGFLSPQEVAGMLGSDFDKVMADIAAANAVADEKGLILDSDPRRTARGGAAQDATQNAAVEIAATGAASPPAA